MELLRDAKGEFLTIDLAGASPPLVFRREEILKATEDILSDEGVRKQYSDDLEERLASEEVTAAAAPFHRRVSSSSSR